MMFPLNIWSFSRDDVDYPLVNVYITRERSTMLLMGKSTISMAMFKFANC
jgi:hypothetical protein